MNFRLEHALNLFGSMNFEFSRGLRRFNWDADTFFIKTKGHQRIRVDRNIFIYCLCFYCEAKVNDNQ